MSLGKKIGIIALAALAALNRLNGLLVLTVWSSLIPRHIPQQYSTLVTFRILDTLLRFDFILSQIVPQLSCRLIAILPFIRTCF